MSRDRQDYTNDPGLISAPGRPLRTDSWEQVRPRVAQLLPANRFSSLSAYYATVQWFNELLDDHTAPKDRDIVPNLAAGLSEEGPKIRKWTREDYIGPVDIGPGAEQTYK